MTIARTGPYILCTCLLLAATPACRRASDTPVVTVASKDRDALLARLGRWDARDGVTDKTIAQCPGCSLTMNGNPKYRLLVGGYTLHFCSATCRKLFAPDAVHKLLALEPPP